MRDEGEHGACIDDWLARAERSSSSPDLLLLFERALNALWGRTKITLGEVTLTAIMERVLHTASAQFPFLSTVSVDPAVGISCGELRGRAGLPAATELRQGIRFVLVEFLVVLGNLTAEILTTELHAELSHLALPEAVRLKMSGDAPEPTQRPSARKQAHDEEN